jgi:hypothetical protein
VESRTIIERLTRSAEDEPQQACSEQRGRPVEKQVDFLYELREFSVFIRSRAVSSPARERLLSQVPSIVLPPADVIDTPLPGIGCIEEKYR